LGFIVFQNSLQASSLAQTLGRYMEMGRQRQRQTQRLRETDRQTHREQERERETDHSSNFVLAENGRQFDAALHLDPPKMHHAPVLQWMLSWQ
jgi:hypothetical protein